MQENKPKVCVFYATWVNLEQEIQDNIDYGYELIGAVQPVVIDSIVTYLVTMVLKEY